MQLFGDPFDDALSWTTSFSRTRFISTDNLSLSSNASFATISDLQGILSIVQSLKLKQIPYNALKEISFIGEGHTFSVVKHQWNDKIVAVKHIKRQILDDDGDVNVSRRRLQSVLQEILIMNHGPVMKHPNIVDLIGYGWQLDNRMPLPYVVVSYGSLGSLRPYLISKAPSSLKHKAMLAGDIAAGLLILHRSGIVHGDLKLDNVVVYPAGDRDFGVIAKICDFGHSITLSTAEKPLRYHGTPLYTPPEALDQIDNPILARHLHKCDIWAFGLCLWEIIIDGSLYFQRSWRSDVNFSRTTLATTIDSMDSAEPYFNTPSKVMTPATTAPPTNALITDPFGSDRDSADACFGNFDLSYLQTLAQKALMNISPRQTWERTYLAPLLRTCLNVNPSKRMSDLDRSPLMNVWHKTNPESALQTQLAMHTGGGDSQQTYDLFRPDRQAEIPWEYQEHIKRDLENVVESKIVSEKLGAAAFQLMACNALGFGCNIALDKAWQNFGIANNCGLPIASLFCDTLADSMTTLSPPMRLAPYTEKVARAFAAQRSLDMASNLSLCDTDEIHCDLNFLDLGKITDMDSNAILNAAISVSEKSRDRVLSTTCLFSSIEQSTLFWLEFAILSDNMTMLQLCCRATPVSRDDLIGAWGETPLILACKKGRPAMVRELLQKGHDYGRSIKCGCNLLHWLFCLKADAVPILNYIVKLTSQGSGLASIINKACTAVHSFDSQWPTEFTGTPLAFAVISGNRSLVKSLLDLGADPTAIVYCPPTTSGPNPSWTPMHLAIKYNFPEISEDLRDHVVAQQSKRKSSDSLSERLTDQLQKGSLQFPDFQLATALSYITPLERFAIHGRHNALRLRETIIALPRSALFWASKHGITPIWQAIDFENIEVVKALLDAAPELAKTEIQDPENETSRMLPLHYAAQICSRRGSSDALIIPELVLAAHNSAYKAIDGDGRTPLHLSVSTNFALVTEWLIKQGCDVNAMDKFGRTPLMLCRSAVNTRMLLQHGADIEHTDNEGASVAHHAVARGADASLSLLIEKGVDLNLSSPTRGTALHVAVTGSSVACVEQLCKAGVLVNSLDRHYNTALSVAVAAKRSDNVEVLMCYGADVTIPNIAGAKPTATVIKQIGTKKPFECSGELRSLQALVNITPTLNNSQKIYLIQLDALHDIAKTNNPALLKFFFSLPYVSKKVSVNSLKDGRTPLHSAAEFHSIETARYLIEKGANYNQTDINGATPLMIVCSSKCKEVNKLNFIDLLLALRPNLVVFDNEGRSAWSIAHEKGDYMIMSRLLDKVSDDDIDLMLHDAPITWHLVDVALGQRQAKFVLACLRHAVHVSFLNDPDVLRDMARAMDCDMNRTSVVAVFNDVLQTNNTKIARDALNGRSIKPWFQRHFLAQSITHEPVYSELWEQPDLPIVGTDDFWESWEKWAAHHRQGHDETGSEVKLEHEGRDNTEDGQEDEKRNAGGEEATTGPSNRKENDRHEQKDSKPGQGGGDREEKDDKTEEKEDDDYDMLN